MNLSKGTDGAPTGADSRLSDQTDEAAVRDMEKDGKTAQTETCSPAIRIDPEVEKRVVRKIDTHVTPLVTFLCMPNPESNLELPI